MIRVLMTSAVATVLLAGGCASTSGPAYVTVPAATYDQAFDAAVEAARRSGLTALLRDRRGGVIETDARIAGSVLEPWRDDNASFGQAIENTLAFQRRRARFEFVPAGFVEPAVVEPDATLTGIDEASGAVPPFDLTSLGTDLELRVWVFVERADMPGLRRSTWSRGLTTRSARSDDGVLPDDAWNGGSQATWTPVDRDVAFEQRLLASVESQLASAATEGAP